MPVFKYKYNDPDSYDRQDCRSERVTVRCEGTDGRCMSEEFFVNYLKAPFCGCYLKLTCAFCGSDKVVFDDYA